jgi:hypothetical protein
MDAAAKGVVVLAPAHRARLTALLQPAALDAAVALHVGQTAQISVAGRWAVKAAHPLPQHVHALAGELAVLRRLARGKDGILVPRVWAWRRDQAALVRDFVAGPTLLEVLLGRAHARWKPEALVALLKRAAAFEARSGVRLDVTPPNLVVTPEGLVLLDAGARELPSPLSGVERVEDVGPALDAYLRWRGAHQQRVLRPLLLPPSGRFHVPVAVGPVRDAAVLWWDPVLLASVGLSWSARQLLLQCNLATHARKKTTYVAATRYQDSPTLDGTGARGDGRSVFLGVVDNAKGTHQLMLKGAGPTPLAWKGHKYHQDGFVSFNRALWEAAVSLELARLGFQTPVVVALLSTGKTTVDNTRQRWPAAAAVRVARTQFRLGHLRRHTGDAKALRVMLDLVGRRVVRADFDAHNPRHQRALVEQFVDTLGHNAGRTDALNIQCFNPTLGNIAVDGTFLDYSTVRFFRFDVPDFRYLNNHRTVGAHHHQWRLFVRHLVDVFALSGMWPAGKVRRMLGQLTRRYEQRFVLGYLQGVNAFAGIPAAVLAALTPSVASLLVETMRAARKLRAPGAMVDFPFWKQSCPAPLLDIPGRFVDYTRALLRAEAQPWRALQSDFVDEIPAAAVPVVQAFHDAWTRAFPTRVHRKAAPRRFDEVIRPGMEVNTLAQLCYAQSTPENHARWDVFMSTAHHLPPGNHGYLDARAKAQALGHVTLPGIVPLHWEVVVGLTPALRDAVVDTLRKTLKQHLVGAVIHGSRVMTRAEVATRTGRRLTGKTGLWLREGGPSHAHSSDLDLKVFLRPGLSAEKRVVLERALGETLRGLGAWFPLVAHVPPRLRLVVTKKRDVRAAFAAYNGAPRLKLQGKPPIPEIQAVVLWDRASQQDTHPWEDTLQHLARYDDVTAQDVAVERVVVPRNAGKDTGCDVDVHALEMVLRDVAHAQPPPVQVALQQDGRYRVVEHAGVVRAVVASGRSTLRCVVEQASSVIPEGPRSAFPNR